MHSHSPHPYPVGAYPDAVHVSAIIGDDHAVTMKTGLSDVCAGHDMTYEPSLTQQNHGRGEQVTGDLSREHWIVPVHGLTSSSPSTSMTTSPHHHCPSDQESRR